MTAPAIGTNMSLEDMRKEAVRHLEEASAIEQKYMGDGAPMMPKTEEDHVKESLQAADLLHAAIAAREEREGRWTKTQQMLDHYRQPVLKSQTGVGERREMSPGDQFVSSGPYLDLKNRNLLSSSLNRLDFGVSMEDGTSLLQWKAVLFGGGATSGGPFIQNDVQSRLVDLLQREINILDLIPRLQTDSDAIEYVQQSTFTNSAAFVPESTSLTATGTAGGVKPESALTYATVTAPVKTVAHWLPVTNRMLADAPGIRGVINSQLLLGLQLVVEAQVISGDGTGENLTGILNTANVQSLARGTLNEVDALFTARTMARTGGKLAPTAIVMNPVDYQQVRLLRENAATGTLGQYLMGPPNTLGIPTVWGLPVVESENIAADTVLVGNFQQGVSLFDREQSAIRVGLVNDQLIRNQQTILAEQRLAFVVWRPSCFVKVTGY
jgi:HK97 family phage major capsid protein